MKFSDSPRYIQLKKRYIKLYNRYPFPVTLLSFLFAMIILLLIFDSFILVLGVITYFISRVVFRQIAILGGFEELYNEWSNFAEYAGAEEMNDPYFFDLSLNFIGSVVIGMISIFKFIPEFIGRFLVLNFPVLEELHIDLSWLLLDFGRIIRTFINLLQFISLIWISRKIKRKIRKSMDQQETDWSKIMHF